MINYRLVITCWVNSYGYHEGYGTGIRVLTLNVLGTTDYFMSVDRRAFKTAVLEALDGTILKNQLFFSYMIACAMFRSQAACQQKSISENMIHSGGGGIMSHTSLPYAKPTSKYLCIFA